MHALVHVHQGIEPGKPIEQLLGLYRDGLLPDAQRTNGYGGLLLLTHPSRREVIAITLWGPEVGDTSTYYEVAILDLGKDISGRVV